LSLNDAKNGVYKISSNLVPGRKRFWLLFGRHPATISSASPNTPTEVLRAFLQPILANGQKIPRLRQYFLWKSIICYRCCSHTEMLPLLPNRPQKLPVGFCSFIAKGHGELYLQCRRILSELATTLTKYQSWKHNINFANITSRPCNANSCRRDLLLLIFWIERKGTQKTLKHILWIVTPMVGAMTFTSLIGLSEYLQRIIVKCMSIQK